MHNFQFLGKLFSVWNGLKDFMFFFYFCFRHFTIISNDTWKYIQIIDNNAQKSLNQRNANKNMTQFVCGQNVSKIYGERISIVWINMIECRML